VGWGNVVLHGGRNVPGAEKTGDISEDKDLRVDFLPATDLWGPRLR
jgi:hypothetical protein